MPAYKKYKQLKLAIDSLQDHYNMVSLSFKLHQKPVTGVLNGSALDWSFESESPVFIKYIPSGMLRKYSLWTDKVPKNISQMYNAISDAALKAGFDLSEKEELV